MKIYTGTGDEGKTSLFSGERIAKNSVRVCAYGTVDELCSLIGAIISVMPEDKKQDQITADLQAIQADLFVMGALLATSPDSEDGALLPSLDCSRVQWLEGKIDEMQADLEELRSFILPGGHPSAAWSQVARCVCRRAERDILSLTESENSTGMETILPYTNRLSDYFFMLARLLNKVSGVEEVSWHG